jgi:glycosyltransferase involved in cell wall biosynthesis
MTSIRVCCVDEEGRYGGPEKRMVQVACELNNHGVITHIVLPFIDADVFLRQIDKYSIPRTQLDITRLTKEKILLFRYIVRFFYETYLLFRFFKKEGFDIIHVNGSYQLKGAISAFLSRTPLVWHLNDTMMAGTVKSAFSYIARVAADGFIVAGRRVHDYYLQNSSLKSRPCEEIHAPVDISLYRLRMGYNLAESGFVKIVTVSGLNPTKGLQYFIRVAIQLYKLNHNLRFYIAGAELSSHRLYAESLRVLIAESNIPTEIINFLGMVEDVPALLNSADICVFTSISEASPTSIWEALAAGVPVVTTDVGSVSQYIEDGISGYITPVADIDALTSRILSLVNDAELRRQLGENGRSVAVRNLDIASAARKHLSIYRRILGIQK